MSSWGLGNSAPPVPLGHSPGWVAVGDAVGDDRRSSIPANGRLAMTTATLDAKLPATKTHEFDVEDVEYLRHGDKPLLARVFKPKGEGPFPALVECHGGAWCLSDRIHREAAPPGHGGARHRVDRARFPLRQRGPLSGFRAGHQLCGALGEAQRPHAQDPSRSRSASPASRAAGIWPCWSPCGRTIRAMPRSRCRPARRRTMRPFAAS